MTSQPKTHVTPEEYLEWERKSECKSEYFICGTPQFADDHRDTLVNSTLIVEVLSKSTKDYDRGEKFEQYRTLESFEEYVLIAQDKHHLEHFIRQPDNTWLLSETNRLEDVVDLTSIGCSLRAAEIYDKVDLLEAE